jgi:hypothetical protein
VGSRGFPHTTADLGSLPFGAEQDGECAMEGQGAARRDAEQAGCESWRAGQSHWLVIYNNKLR